MYAFLRDLVYGVRIMRRSPGLTIAATLALALGIGVNTAIFSGLNGIMLKPLPYPDFERLVVPATVFNRHNTDRGSISYPDFLDWRSESRLFEAVAAWRGRTFDVTGADEIERVRGAAVSEDFFRVFEVAPAAGRVLVPEDHLSGGGRVAVISYGLWTRRFGRDPKVVGAEVEISGTPWRIAGVMPDRFAWPEQAELWAPLGFAPKPPDWTMRRDNHVFSAIARLREGVSLAHAQAVLSVRAERIAREEKNRAGTGWKLHPLRRYIVGRQLETVLVLLFAAVTLVLAIACANVANLLLARGASRGSEIAVRMAIGARPGRLIRQFLTESALLAAAGSVVGLAVAYWCVQAIVRLAPDGLPRVDEMRIDGHVLAFTAGLSILTSIAFGLLPALLAVRRSTAGALHEAGRRVAGSHARIRSVLVVSELAFSVILLAGAGLLIRSLLNLQRVDPGFATHNMLTMSLSLPQSRYKDGPQAADTFARIGEEIGRIPGVVASSAVSALPLGGGGFYLGRVFLKQGAPEPPAGKDTAAQWNIIRPGYFRMMGIPLLQGRDFTERDGAAATPVIVISRSMAREMFPNENPIGRRIRSWRDENLYREIIGICGDAAAFGLDGQSVNLVYVPHRQNAWRGLMLTVRTKGDPYAAAGAIRGAVRATDAKLAVSDIKTMDEVLDAAMAFPRFTAMLLGMFAAAALALAAIGVYGVMSYAVTRRTREIGIRVALGAGAGRILGGVLGQGLLVVGAGLAAGLAGAIGLTRFMRTLIFGVEPADTATLAAIAVVLLIAGLAACWVPARRALRVDPVSALRQE